MLDMIKELFSTVDIFLANLHCRKGRFDKARRFLNRALRRSANEFDFLVAYDAFLMIRENRLPEAQLRFEECMKAFRQSKSEDHKYISLYCEFFLSIFKSTGEAIELRNEAVKLEADALTKTFLKFPSEKEVTEILFQ
jgi:tetratricopeptide (TPR) repeat protein